MKKEYAEGRGYNTITTEQAGMKRSNAYKVFHIGLFLVVFFVSLVITIYYLSQVNAIEQETLVMISSVERMESIVLPEGLEQQEIPVDADAAEESKRVYLTFDDGPSIYTGQILDILKENNVKATFFVIARENENYWPYYSRILEEGHTLGMHSYTHDYSQIYASLNSFATDVNQLSQFLYERTGEYPTIYRFPGGSSNSVCNVSMQECIAYLNEAGIVYYDWNALNGDAVTADLSPEQLIENIMNSVRQNNTSIVLMHDMQSKYNTVESLQGLIDILKEEGYQILPIDENTPLIQHVPYDTGFQEAAD